MQSLIVTLLTEAGICGDGAAEMFVAAAIGTLETGDRAAQAYRERLTAIVRVLARGFARAVEE